MLFSNQQLKTDFEAFLKQTIDLKQSNNTKQLTLNIIQIGNNLSSCKYISLKQKIGSRIGINVILHHFEDNQLELESSLKAVVGDVSRSNQGLNQGLIFQLPISSHLEYLINEVPVDCDVDMLGINSQSLWSAGLLPPTVGAVDLVLKQMLKVDYDNFGQLLRLKLDLSSYRIAIIGQGKLVGKPLVKYCLNRRATIVIIDKDTFNPQSLVKDCDIVLSGAGVAKLVNSTWLKSTAIVIDVATSGENGVIVGDVDQADLPTSIYLCPSPKGVGPITVLYLFWNLCCLRS